MAEQRKLTKREKITQLEKLADRLERMRFGDYVTNLNKASRIIWINLLAGISRGVGLTIGATVVIMIIFKIISAVVSMNVPYLSPMMQEIKQTLESRYNPTRRMHSPDHEVVIPQTKKNN